MKSIGFIILFFISLCVQAQQQSLVDVTMPDEKENVHVVPLESDSLSSAFLIFVRNAVPLHMHEHHTESIYVLQGNGEMVLGKDTLFVQSGDFVFIPTQTPHSVKVRSAEPLKVLSVQSPFFDGSDRILLE